MPANEILADRLVRLLGVERGKLEARQFPDTETYLRFADEPRGRDVILICTLDRPDTKIMPLLFAAEAARDLGARRVGLVTPYLSYMRQDKRFRPGEAVTSHSFANLISRAFDWLVTVDPHLHRNRSLAEIYSIPTRSLHAGPAIANWIRQNVVKPYLIGPDAESRQWVEGVAVACGAPWTVAQKTRLGDTNVHEQLLAASIPQNATPVLLDDIVSSGATLMEAVRVLKDTNGQSPIAIAIHGLCNASTEAALKRAGAGLVTTNSVPNPTAQIDIVPVIAKGLAEFMTLSA